MSDSEFEPSCASDSDSEDEFQLEPALEAALLADRTCQYLSASDSEEETQASKPKANPKTYSAAGGIKSTLFSSAGACPLHLSGINKLRRQKFPYNPKLPPAESLLTDDETARVHFIAYHLLSEKLIANGYVNYTHKRVSVSNHLISCQAGSQGIPAQQISQQRSAYSCLRLLLERHDPLLTTHRDFEVCDNAMSFVALLSSMQRLKKLYCFLEETDCQQPLPADFRHVALVRASRPASHFFAIRRHWVQLLTATSRPADDTHAYCGLGTCISWTTFVCGEVKDSVTNQTFANPLKWFLNCWYRRAKQQVCTEDSMRRNSEARMNECLPPGYTVRGLEMVWHNRYDVLELKASTRRNFAISYLAAADAAAALTKENCDHVTSCIRKCCTTVGKAHTLSTAKPACAAAVLTAEATIENM